MTSPAQRSAARVSDGRGGKAHLRLALLGIALWTVASLARAGITIHFEGAVASDAGVQKVVDGATARAQRNGWRVQRVGAGEVATLDSVTLKAMEEIEGTSVPGEWRGVVIYPHEMCEPLYLVFGAKRKTKNHVKTQFAGADVHVKVVELLEALRPMFAELELDDEGEYASTHDRAKLERHLTTASAAMDGLRVNTPGARGPVKRPDGRILDIVR